MTPLKQAFVDFSAADQALTAADGAKASNDAALATAKSAAATTDQADADAVKVYNEKRLALIAALTDAGR